MAQRLKATHYLCLPLSSPTSTSRTQLQRSLDLCKEDVLSVQESQEDGGLVPGFPGWSFGVNRPDHLDSGVCEVPTRTSGGNGNCIGTGKYILFHPAGTASVAILFELALELTAITPEAYRPSPCLAGATRAGSQATSENRGDRSRRQINHA